MAEAEATPADPEATPAAAETPPAPAPPTPAELLWAATQRRLSRLGWATLARWDRLLATIVAGLACWSSFAPLNWWWAAVPAFAGLAWVLTRPNTTVGGGFGYGLLFGLAFYLPLLPWIAGLVGDGPWLALTLLCALFPALFGPAAVLVRTLPGWPVLFALAWASQEWLKSVIPFGGFPWGMIGFGQTRGPLLPLVALGGPATLSVAVVLLGAAATALGGLIVDSLRHDDDRTPAVLAAGSCICVVLIAVAVVTPGVRRAGVGAGTEPAITVAAVQGNVPRLGLDFNAQREEVLRYHVRETLRLAEDVRAGLAPQPRLVVWPENASDIDPLTDAAAARAVTTAAQAIEAPILVGTVRTADGWSRDNPVALNTVLVWDPAHGPGEIHDKRIVQPFGEYLPWRGLFRHLSSYADRAGYFVPGHGSGVVHAAGVPVGVATCWEVIFDRALRSSVLAGAQLLAVPANNATFNATMSEQQLAFAKVRAVELDRYLVVAGTTGISAIIAPDGRELGRTEFFQPAYLDAQVRLKTSLTPAVRFGTLLQELLAGAGVVGVLAAMLHNGVFIRRRTTGPAEAAGDGDDATDCSNEEESLR